MDTVTIATEKNWVLTLIGSISWAIWRARCDHIYSKKQLVTSHVIQFGSRLAFEYREATTPTPIVRAPVNKGCWLPPPPGYAAINCDASWKPPSTGGLGVVIKGMRMESRYAVLPKNAMSGSVEIAEAQAVLVGINLAVESHLKKIRVQSDSRAVIEELNTTTAHRNWKILPIIEEIHRRSRIFEDVRWV